MDVNQLTMGNIVYFETDEATSIKTIDRLDYVRKRIWFENDSVERLSVYVLGIPLTLQWLFDLGFTYQNSPTQTSSSIQIYRIENVRIFCMRTVKAFSFYPGNKDIQHVHQLQNEYFETTGRVLVHKYIHLNLEPGFIS